MHDFLRTNLNIRTPTLERLDLSAEEFLALFNHRLTWVYFGFVLVILLVSDPSHLFSSVPLPIYGLAWLGAFFLYLSVHAALILGLAALRHLSGRNAPAVYWPLISILAYAPTVSAMETVLAWAVGDSLRPLLLQRVGYVAVTIIMFETIFLRFVLPRVMADTELPDHAPMPPMAAMAAAAREVEIASSAFAESDASAAQERKIHIGARPVPLDEVAFIEAREHHVHVRLRHGTLSQRARLSDIVAQTSAEDGVQPHRSWWVSRHSVRELGRDDGKPVLRLTDESVIPVARGRLESVRDWIATYMI